METLAALFTKQGIQYHSESNVLWCSYCTAYFERLPVGRATTTATEIGDKETELHTKLTHFQSEATVDERGSSANPLCIVEGTKEGILAHCATREHLLLYEQHTQDGLKQWCPVDLHGCRVLLDHHCIYPSQMFGRGRILMDDTICRGMLLATDVCGGVKLFPQHRYSVIELVLPSCRSGVRGVELPCCDINAVDEATTVGTHRRRSRSTSLASGNDEDPKCGGDGSLFCDDSLIAWRRSRRRRLQLLHETTEIFSGSSASLIDVEEESVSTHKSDEGNLKRNDTVRCSVGSLSKGGSVSGSSDLNNLSFVPRYFEGRSGTPNHTVNEGALAIVLQITNASIVSEARVRHDRQRQFAEQNYVVKPES